MTYKNKEIGIPTLEMITDIIKRRNMVADPEYVYNYYTAHKWRNKKGFPIKRLEIAIGAINGLFYHKNKPKKIPPLKKLKCSESYARLLQDKRWKAFRNYVLKEKGCCCEMCGSKTHLQIHHPKYISGRMPWDYSLTEVQLLCGKCHTKVHGVF